MSVVYACDCCGERSGREHPTLSVDTKPNNRLNGHHLNVHVCDVCLDKMLPPQVKDHFESKV